MTFRALAFLFAVLGFGVSSALAQSAPAGSCLLENGTWCWPIETTIYGQPCLCPTPSGTMTGTTQ